MEQEESYLKIEESGNSIVPEDTKPPTQEPQAANEYYELKMNKLKDLLNSKDSDIEKFKEQLQEKHDEMENMRRQFFNELNVYKLASYNM